MLKLTLRSTDRRSGINPNQRKLSFFGRVDPDELRLDLRMLSKFLKNLKKDFKTLERIEGPFVPSGSVHRDHSRKSGPSRGTKILLRF